MNRSQALTLRLALLPSLVVAAAPSVARSAETQPATRPATTLPAAPAPDGTRRAYLKIEVNVPAGPWVAPRADLAVELLDRRAAELAPAWLGMPAQNVKESLALEPMVTSANDLAGLQITVNLTDPNARPVALAFADALVETLRQHAAEHLARVRSKEIDAAKAALAAAEIEVRRGDERARELKNRMRDASGRTDVSAQSIGSAVAKLEEEKQRLELDILGKEARRDALERHIAIENDRAAQRAQSDAIVTELQKVVEAREAQVERMKQMAKSAAASQTEVEEAIGRVAEARAKLLERRHGAAIEGGGDALPSLERERITLSIDLRELGARREYVESRLPRLREALDLLDEFARATEAVAEGHNAYRRAEEGIKQVHERFGKEPAIEIKVVDRSATAEPWLPPAPPPAHPPRQ